MQKICSHSQWMCGQTEWVQAAVSTKMMKHGHGITMESNQGWPPRVRSDIYAQIWLKGAGGASIWRWAGRTFPEGRTPGAKAPGGRKLGKLGSERLQRLCSVCVFGPNLFSERMLAGWGGRTVGRLRGWWRLEATDTGKKRNIEELTGCK